MILLVWLIFGASLAVLAAVVFYVMTDERRAKRRIVRDLRRNRADLSRAHERDRR